VLMQDDLRELPRAVAIARRSRRDRRSALRVFALSFVAGLVIALWLPHRVPLTEGSAATMVAILVLWIAGGSMAIMGLAGLIGAWFSRPPPESTTQRLEDR